MSDAESTIHVRQKSAIINSLQMFIYKHTSVIMFTLDQCYAGTVEKELSKVREFVGHGDQPISGKNYRQVRNTA